MRGESHQPSYEALNPQGRVPALEDNGRLIPQSMAICEYLEETHPHPSILPTDPFGRARVRALALMVAQPSMIKRPVLDLGGKLLVGFKPQIYAREVAPSGRSRRD